MEQQLMHDKLEKFRETISTSFGLRDESLKMVDFIKQGKTNDLTVPKLKYLLKKRNPLHDKLRLAVQFYGSENLKQLL